MTQRYNKILKVLQRKIEKLISDLIKQGKSESDIKKEVRKFIKKYNPYKRLSEQFLADANSTIAEAQKNVKNTLYWISERTRVKPSKSALNILIKANQQFAIIDNKVRKGILDAVESAVNNNQTKKQLVNNIEKSVSGAYRAETIANTSLQSYSQAISIDEERAAGIEKWKYVGQSPERDFCKQHYNNTYTYEEIQAMDNQQGLAVLYFRGGYNCTHKWRPVIDDALIEKLKTQGKI